jgi:hypothetical protein
VTEAGIVWQRCADGKHLGATVIVGRVFHFEACKHHRLWRLRVTEITADGTGDAKVLGALETLRDARNHARAVALQIRYQLEAVALGAH